MKSTRKIIYLTFDIDWACDEVIAKTLDILEREDIPATLFITHDTPLLARMRQNEKLELGAHPNFIPLDLGNCDVSHFLDYAQGILQQYKDLVPEATTVRAHGLTQNSRLLDLMAEMGYTRESNLLITLSSGMNLRAFYHWNGIMRVPYFWEDDIHCVEMERKYWDSWDAEPFLDNSCLKVFDFHPIHIFLNTETLDRYEKARPYFQQPEKLRAMENKEVPGDHDFFLNLIRGAKERGYTFGLLRDIHPD